MFGFDFLSFGVGLCLGLIVMAIIADRCCGAQIEEMRHKAEDDSRFYWETVSGLEAKIDVLEKELEVQQNAVKVLSENNKRLCV